MAAPPEDAQVPAAPDAQALQEVIPAQAQPPVDPVVVNYIFSSFFFRLLASLFRHASVLVFVRYALHVFSVGCALTFCFLACQVSLLVCFCIFCFIPLGVCTLLGYLVFCLVWICTISFLWPRVHVHVFASYGICY